MGQANCETATAIAALRIHEAETAREAQLIMAACEFAGGDVASARSRYEFLLADGNDARALRGMGTVLLAGGDAETAMPYLERAVVAAPADWRAWNALGISWMELDQRTEAINAFRRATEIAPTSATPWNNLGLAYLQDGQSDAAVSAFTQALRREPGLPAAEANLRLAFLVRGETSRALRDVSEDERPILLNNAGVIARSQGDLRRAESLFQRALEASPVFYEQAYSNWQEVRAANNQP